jgi:hypothetical protein
MNANKISWVMAFVLVLVLGTAPGESIYVIDHYSNLFVFDVINDVIVYRDSIARFVNAGVDLAIDEDHNTLFRNVEFEYDST